VKFITSKEASVFFEQQGELSCTSQVCVVEQCLPCQCACWERKALCCAGLCYPIPSPDKGNIIQKDIEDAWAQMLAGNVSAEQGLAQLDQKIKANL